ncbi:MAG: tetratricopeptide repeat protein [Planctomycetota bacterium]|jgi:tetratricopeptide (TPR) repeat protein
MATDDWMRVKTLFNEAIKLPDGERAAFLDEVCKDDQALRARLEALLDADSDAETFLEQPALASKPPPDEDSSDLDTSIGPYKLKRIISSGGMGIVYEALQEKPHRTVAIKVMKEGFATKEALLRFEYESEILARLNHPHIAQVIEAGTHEKDKDSLTQTGAGVPYIVMEFIEDARPITSHVHEKKLSIKERIELFLQVCQAVHHGHLRGVIHRDLKPSNILVNSQGRVKVIDFGVARATGRDVAETLFHTEVGQLIGTVRYMSPEQCKADPNDLDVRSDVYTLGMVFYEMLLDTLPYDVEETTIYEAVRIIQEEPPKRPSFLDRSLRGDVETVLLKALEKDRKHRYQTVMEMANDLERHLRGEVILARPAGTMVRVAKWVKRNPVVSTAMGLSVLSLIVFLFYVFMWYNPRILAERDKAEAVNRFLVQMIGSPDPLVQGIDVKVVDILDRGAEKVRGAFVDQPAVKAELQKALGWTYMSLGQYESAEEHFRAAEKYFSEEYGDQYPSTLELRNCLAVVIREQSRFEESEDLNEKTLEDCRSVLGNEHSLTIEVMDSLASIYFYQKKLSEAEELYKESMALQRRVLGNEHIKTLRTMRNYANVLREMFKLDESEKILLKVYESCRRLLGEEHMDTLLSMGSLGNLYDFQRRYDEAEAIKRKQWELQKRVMGPEHPYTLTTYNNLINTLRDADRNGEAEAMARKLLDVARRVYGPDARNYLMVVENLAAALKNQGKYEEALPYIRETLEKRTKLFGKDNLLTLQTMNLLAIVEKNLGNYEESEKLNRTVLEKRREILGPDHPETILSLSNLANVLGRLGKLAEAEAIHREGLEKRKRILGDEHPDTLASMYNLANMLRQQDKFEEAEPLLRDSLNLRLKVQGEEHPHTILTQEILGKTLVAKEEYAEAEELFRKVWQVRKRIRGPEHSKTLGAQELLADVLEARGEKAETEALYLELAEVHLRLKGAEHEDAQNAIRKLIDFYEAQGREAEAAKWKKKKVG